MIADSYNKLLHSWGTEFQEKDIESSYGLTHVITVGDHQGPPLLHFEEKENQSMNIRGVILEGYSNAGKTSLLKA